jgi:membrane protein
VVLAMVAFSVSILLTTMQEFVVQNMRGGEDLAGLFTLLRFAPAFVLFGSLYMLFLALTPKRYRRKGCRRWPGPAFVTVWWLATTALLPTALSSLGGYDMTYGSLAGVIIALVFFFVIGLGVVMGAELNAALAETPEERLQEGEEMFYNRESI